MSDRYDAFLLVSFGGPEKHEDVIPFLENVLRGKNVPRERMLEVAEHYYHFDGLSPINDQCRALIAALQPALPLPIYWGNRNWTPLLAGTVARMRRDGIKRALALVTSAFGSYSGCRQYREDIERARAEAGEGAPEIDKLPPFHDHPGFVEAVALRVRDALAKLPVADVVYTAHSIPVSMAQSSPYEGQLRKVCSRVNAQLGLGEPVLVFQSRSGPPSQPWLEPDIGQYIAATDAKRLIVVPVGFLSDHMEVLYDLDTEAAALAKERGIEFVRAATVGTHPRFVEAIVEMVHNAMETGPRYVCPADCCQRARPAANRQFPASG
jgi:protoporphyrin/coproporphyrin ferrochelatase